MLHLTRRRHQGIMIGNDIRIVVMSIHGDEVSIGIAAPKSVRIDRDEVRARISEQERRRSLT